MGAEVELNPVARPCGLYREYIKGKIKKILLFEEQQRFVENRKEFSTFVVVKLL